MVVCSQASPLRTTEITKVTEHAAESLPARHALVAPGRDGDERSRQRVKLLRQIPNRIPDVGTLRLRVHCRSSSSAWNAWVTWVLSMYQDDFMTRPRAPRRSAGTDRGGESASRSQSRYPRSRAWHVPVRPAPRRRRLSPTRSVRWLAACHRRLFLPNTRRRAAVAPASIRVRNSPACALPLALAQQRRAHTLSIG